MLELLVDGAVATLYGLRVPALNGLCVFVVIRCWAMATGWGAASGTSCWVYGSISVGALLIFDEEESETSPKSLWPESTGLSTSIGGGRYSNLCKTAVQSKGGVPTPTRDAKVR
eukprot:gene4038-biopygen12367